MARVFGQDTEENRKERKSYQVLFGLMNTDIWSFLGRDNHDHGVDYSFEYIENGEFRGYRILAQIKGSKVTKISNNEVVFDLPVKTANYAVGSSQPFILFFVNLLTECAYYLPLQDYFIANPDKMDALEKNTSTIRVFIPLNNTIEDPELVAVAKSQYSFDEEHGLRKTR
ncbi:MAG: DUF4365 domain-containing protein [Ruminococcus sp.]|nr:DUF4365 domain-containing protein [Ruminococcus sp.]